MDTLYITRSCALYQSQIWINGQRDFIYDQSTDFIQFIKSAYKHYKIGFPKFYKMDNLSKLAFITSEILLMGLDIKGRYQPDEIGIILINSSSTLNTDERYDRTIADKSNYFPSPAVFVYTLPNIMVGEISIRNKIMGENITFVAEKYNPQNLHDFVEMLFLNDRVKGCICGWVEFDRDGQNYESLMYFIEKEDFNDRNIKFAPLYLEKNYCDLKV